MRMLLHLVAAVLLLATQVWGSCEPLVGPAGVPSHNVHHGMVGKPDVLGDTQAKRAAGMVLVWHDRTASVSVQPPAPSPLRPVAGSQRPAFHPRRPPPRAAATDSDLSD